MTWFAKLPEEPGLLCNFIPITRWKMNPDMITSAFLPVVAMEMALTAQPISAEQALEYGLIARLAEPGKAVDSALELAELIAKNAPLAVAASKQLIRESQGRTEEEYAKLQRPLAAKIFRSEDAKEGPLAFVQKRSPNWQGR